MTALRRRLPTVLLVLVATAVLTGLLIALSGANPVTGLKGLVLGVFGSEYRLGEVLVGATPLCLIALSVAPSLRAGIFSVGAPGQAAIGALAATAALQLVTWWWPSAPAVVLLPVGAVGGIAGGMLWALVPALLKVAWDVNEILSTLLLNYLAVQVLGYSLRTWLAASEQTATPQSDPLPFNSHLPPLVASGMRAHWGILLVGIAAVALAVWRSTSNSTRIDVFGARPTLAARLGSGRRSVVLGTLLVSGAGAGLAGWVQLVGLSDRLYPSVADSIGFTGIAVALLGVALPVGIVVAAVLYASLAVGALGLQSATGTTPSSIAEVIQAVLLLGVAAVFGARPGAARTVGQGRARALWTGRRTREPADR